ncbi:Dimethyl-sulfide monooxygenase [compost metagenome]
MIPELQRRGAYKTAYEPGSLREKLFASQQPHLPADHPGASYRHTTPTGAPQHA